MKNPTKPKKQKEILARLATAYADAKPALHFKNPYELLVAVLLSAQCTDERVNIVTKELFLKAPDAVAMADLGEERVREIIRSCGLYKNKAKNIVALSKILAAQYGGEVPSVREDLEALPGIGRKSANVVMSVAFGLPAIAVDTHVFRVSRRMGFSQGKDVRKVENDLMALIPQEDWGAAHHWLIFHGRRVCKAVKPLCDRCPVGDICPRLVLKNKEK
ncbi:MAG TPA: endonuclease III [Clostridiales bacterium]|nr:endonuclease III [Clostridiales bacterium]